MKIIKISAIWCGACLIMNKIWNKLKNNYDFEAIELDYDMDEEEVKKYNVGDVLPVFIICSPDDKEIMRIKGEISYKDFAAKIEGIGDEK